jgi:hypothetical protein
MFRYILEGHKAIPCDDPHIWSVQFASTNRVVALTKEGEVEVSTVFLGIDHNFGSYPPLLFETMVFKNRGKVSLNHYYNTNIYDLTERYATWEEAEQGHLRICKKVYSDIKILANKEKQSRMLRPIELKEIGGGK